MVFLENLGSKESLSSLAWDVNSLKNFFNSLPTFTQKNLVSYLENFFKEQKQKNQGNQPPQKKTK